MSHDDHAHTIPTDYEGDFEFTNGKLGMWLFLVSDAMAFVGFLGAYMVLRMSTLNAVSPTPEAITLTWKPDWSPHLDLVATGMNTFVLIISSVTMVKALAAFQDGFINKGKMFLLATICGGSFFVGFQVWEWNHLIHEGVSMSGLQVPDLDTAAKRARLNGSSMTRLGLASELFGGRTIPDDWDQGKLKNFTEEEYVNLPIETRDGTRDLRPKYPGVIHLASFSIPPVATHIMGPDTDGDGEADGEDKYVTPWFSSDALYELRTLAEEEEEGGRAGALAKQRAGLALTSEEVGVEPAPGTRTKTPGARVANLFSSSFFVLTGFHGLHVLIGVIYLWVVFFRARAGAYGPENNSPVEVAGLYWHFVDLVWVLLFMLIYLL